MDQREADLTLGGCDDPIELHLQTRQVGLGGEQSRSEDDAGECPGHGSDAYRKPNILARFIGVLYKIMPKIGPFRPLAFKVPPPDAERLFLESLTRTRARYATALESFRAGRLNLADINLDTGKPAARGEYALADETFAEPTRRVRERSR